MEIQLENALHMHSYNTTCIARAPPA